MNRKRNKMGIIVLFALLFSIGTISLASSALSPDLEEGEIIEYDVKYTVSGTDDGEEYEIVSKGTFIVTIDKIEGNNITYTWVYTMTASGTIPDSWDEDISDYDTDQVLTFTDLVDDDFCEDGSGYLFIDPNCELTYENSDDGSDPDYTRTSKLVYDSAGRVKSVEETEYRVYENGDIFDYTYRMSRGGIIPSYPTVIIATFSIIGISALLLKKRH